MNKKKYTYEKINALYIKDQSIIKKQCWKSICVDVHKNGKPTIPWEDTKAGCPSNQFEP